MPDRATLRREVNGLVTETRARASLVGRSALALWAIEVVDWLVMGGRLDAYGVRPRSIEGLLGIAFAPLLHGGFGHLLANTVPFVLLGFLVTARKRMDFWVVAAASALAAGLGTWAIGGAGTVHIGASGVVFGFLGFLMGRGIYERRAGTIVLSLVVTVLFGGMLTGVLPTVGPGISWEGHLFGWLGGLATARALGSRKKRRG